MPQRQDDRPLVNIIVTSFNRVEATAQCIESIHASTDHPFRLTVVDDASQDASRDYLLQLKRKGRIDSLFLFERNMGVAVACNMGLQAEDADFHVKFDNDNLALQGCWLDDLIAVTREHENIGAVAYDIYNSDRHGETDFCGASVMLIPRVTRERLGWFAEEYGKYGEEDGDFGLRVRKAGLRNFYLPCSGRVRHDMTRRSYGSQEADQRRTRESRREAIYTHYFNCFLYNNALRQPLNQRRFIPRKRDNGLIWFEENPAHRELFERLEPYRRQFIEENRELLEAYIRSGP